LLAAIAGLLLAAAAGPEVIRVRVPASDISKWFRPGTNLRVLTPKEFESKVEAAFKMHPGSSSSEAPRLIRARHQARWKQGILSGRTELVLRAGKGGQSEYVLEPWSPAIIVSPQTARLLAARDSGKVVLSLDASPREQTVALEWELQARATSNGRSFTIALPGDETAVLALDIPRGWIVSSQREIRRGPLPATDPARSSWEIDAKSGPVDIELHDPEDSARPIGGSSAWVSGNTEVNLRGMTERGRELVNWTTEWRLEPGPRHAGHLEVELDPGLELVDVQGPIVRSYRLERDGSLSRVVIALQTASPAESVLRVLAHALVPSRGTWSIPAMRPRGATWTGGTTTVYLDALHVVSDYREKAGRLIVSDQRNAGRARLLSFEATGAGSVADLVFKEPRTDASCTVQGQVHIGDGLPRFECRADWVLHRGSTPEVAMDLSPHWSPDQVQIDDLDEPAPWHASSLPSGELRLRIMLPSTVLVGRKWTVRIDATATAPTGRGPLELPRVRAVGAAMLDEAWLAWVAQGATIHPVQARGLTWIDPADAALTLNPDARPNLRPALGWRWTGAEGFARIDWNRTDTDPRATIGTLVQVGADGRELSIEGTLKLRSGSASCAAIPIWISQPRGGLEAWHFRTEDGGELAVRPIDDDARSRLGLPRDGTAGSLAVSLPAFVNKSIQFRAKIPWKSGGLVPVLALPEVNLERATILIEAHPGMRCRADVSGVVHLSPAAVAQLRTELNADDDTDDQASRSAPGRRIVHAFAYTEPGAKLKLDTEPLARFPVPGMVREAVLTTSLEPAGRALNRLRLLAQPEPERSLELDLPPRSTLIRVRRDGSDITPVRSGSHIAVPAAASAGYDKADAIQIDYVTEPGAISDGDRLHADVPTIRLPCLSFVWEMVTPPGWKALDSGPGLCANNRDDPSSWLNEWIGLWKPSWTFFRGRATVADAERLRQLDERLSHAPADDITFAECFSRWDSTGWPIVVDRLALDSAGIGPRAVCGAVGSQSERRSVSLVTLQQHGLALVAFPDLAVVTTEVEAPRFSQHERWNALLLETLVWGSDRTDRFQTLQRWRSEGLPGSTGAPGDEPAERLKSLPGRVTWRFSRSGWPGADSFVHVVDTRRRIIAAWMVIGLLTVLWNVLGLRLRRGRFVALALLAAGSVAVERLVPSRDAALPAASFSAFVALFIWELGRAAWQSSAPARGRGRSQSSMVRQAAHAAIGASVVLSLSPAIASLRAAQPGAGSPMLALFPYSGSFDPSQPPDRVILRLEDFTRLTKLAESRTPSPVFSVNALSATHRVVPIDAQNIVVESDFDLVARGDSPLFWELPVASARDLEAQLDGVSQPIAIDPGGLTARIAIPRPGHHILHVRRSADARTDDLGFETLSLPVNPMPTAQVRLEPHRGSTAPAEILAHGRITEQPDGTLAGALGPASRIVIRWGKAGSRPAHRSAGLCDGIVLWDVTPAGDRIRARLTWQQRSEISTLRLAHDPSLILRSAQASSRADVFYQDDARHGDWVLNIDPPLAAGSTLTLDCWRPADAPTGDGTRPGGPSSQPQEVDRSIPRIQPLGVERFTGVLGVRRPGYWTGRLQPSTDSEAPGDEAFVKAWGRLPDEPLTLAGTSRFIGDLRATLHTGPAPVRVRVRLAVQLRIEAGRVALAGDAELAELAGHLPLIDVALPDEIQITQVTGDGLADWTIRPDRRLRLIWEYPAATPRRRVHIAGWIPLHDDPVKVGPRLFRLPTPWFGWPGAEDVSGTLVVDSATARPVLQGAIGLTPLPPEPGAAGEPAMPRFRLSYRVHDAARLGEIRWEAVAPRVNVTIESQLTLHPNLAEWTVALRYDASGGALDAIHFKMPASWAANVKLQPRRHDFQAASEIRGPLAFWTITPRRPIWGSHRFVLRSTLPLRADPEIEHPEIAPLGRGAVDAYLGIVNATGQPLSVEGSNGLQPIPYQSRFQDRAFAGDVGTPDRAYRVIRESWTLRIHLPRRSGTDSRPAGDDSARIALADVAMAILPDRSAVWRSVYDTVPSGGRLLTIDLPAGSSIQSATVDGNPAVPLRSATGSWAFVLDGRGQNRICLVGNTQETPAGSRGAHPARWSITLPRAGAAPARTLLTVTTPLDVGIAGVTGGLQQSTEARLEIVRGDGLARSIRDFLGNIDRGSGRGHELLVTLLINHELALRAAERSTRFWESGASGEPPERASQTLESIAAARRSVADAIESAGLSDDLARARAYLGQSSDGRVRATGTVREPAAVDRIPTIGRQSALLGIVSGTEELGSTTTLTLVTPPGAPLLNHWPARAVLIMAVLLAAAMLAALQVGRRLGSLIAILAVLGVAGYAGGPIMLAAGLGLAALAGHSARNSVR
jgi:hypothetical protein